MRSRQDALSRAPTPGGPQHVALVTGAFSGIGEATALALAQAGWVVYATGRSIAKSEALMAQARGLNLDVRVLTLDVTDEDSIAAAIDHVAREAGRLDVLVNNAGSAVHGAVTETSNAQIRHLFETNALSVVALARAVLPLMSRHGQGRIVNISSVLGKIAFPGSGIYSATKFAVEALSDAMRLEFKLLGPSYHVIVVEVPEIKTKLGVNAVFAEYGDSPSSLYGDFNALARHYVEHVYERAPGPDVVARAVVTAATAARPRTRYVVTAPARAMLWGRRFLPDRAFDALTLWWTPHLRRRVARRRGAGTPARSAH